MLWTSFLILAALAVVGLMSVRWFTSVPASDVAQALRAFVAAFGALASTGLIYSGRLGLAVVTIGAAAYAIHSLRRNRRPPDPIDGDDGGLAGAAGDSSEVRTAWLTMRLRHANGELDGSVESGPYAGAQLSQLDFRALMDLKEQLAAADPEGVPLLEAYLDRYEPSWRDDRPAAADDGSMDRAKALAILGLEEGANETDIRRAHKELMARLHPDRGGSTFLASQINAARAFLLGRR